MNFVCVFILLYEFLKSNKREHLNGNEHCFHVNGLILHVDICAHRHAFLYLHALCLLAAVYAGTVVLLRALLEG